MACARRKRQRGISGPDRPLTAVGGAIVTRLCADDPEAVDRIDQATQNPASLHVHDVDNVHNRPDGNTAQAAIRRLRKDRPDLHEQVLARRISPHAAMIEAGFRPKTITVPLDPQRMARAIRRRLSDDEIDTTLQDRCDGTGVLLIEEDLGDALSVARG